MKILIETSGGGGVVLLIALALLASHGGGVSAALAAVVIALAVAVVLAVAGLGAYLVYRPRNPSPEGFVRTPLVRHPSCTSCPARSGPPSSSQPCACTPTSWPSSPRSSAASSGRSSHRKEGPNPMAIVVRLPGGFRLGHRL